MISCSVDLVYAEMKCGSLLPFTKLEHFFNKLNLLYLRKSICFYKTSIEWVSIIGFIILYNFNKSIFFTKGRIQLAIGWKFQSQREVWRHLQCNKVHQMCRVHQETQKWENKGRKGHEGALGIFERAKKCSRKESQWPCFSADGKGNGCQWTTRLERNLLSVLCVCFCN